MPSMQSLLPKLSKDFSAITLSPGEIFQWSPSTSVVSYKEDEDNVSLLLHELAHGVLGHHDYSTDVELLQMESSAWDEAMNLAERYKVEIDEDMAQEHLDTYREWLHARSTCPECEATGYQTAKNTYSCVACSHQWRVNEARLCGLKRYSLSN